MDARDSDSEATGIHESNGNGTGYDDREDLSRSSDRALLESIYRRGVETDQRVSVLYNALQAHREDEARRWRANDKRSAMYEEALFELVASDRSRRTVEADIRDHIEKVRVELTKKVEESKRTSLIDEEERAVVVRAANAHIDVRAVERVKAAEIEAAAKADALEARKTRRALFVDGAKRVASIVGVPLLTAIATAAAVLIAKGC